MKTVLVTGAGGYIGRHVVGKLCDAGADVVTLDMGSETVDSRARHISFDLLDARFCISDYFNEAPDVCLHLAWRNGFQHNDSSHMNDLSGHYRFLESLLDGGVSQIAVMGSMHEIGYWEGPISGETPCNPLSLYGVAKDALRKSLFLRAEKTTATIQWLRGFYIYGDDAGAQSIFGKITRAAAAGETTFPFTSGTNKYDFLSVEELSLQIASCVMQNEVSGVINCCSGVPVSLADQVEHYVADRGLDISLDYGAYPDRPYDSPAVWGDPSKIRSIMKASSLR